MTLREFCAWSRLGKTSAYREVRAGRLRIVKTGAKTLILMSDAEAWLRSLPTAAA
ncbi:excisionase [Bradyrhizobium centrolobii]|uniref:Excisionase n=2 Tax=Bradyrhizobium centrolobii TaxID=1505087 RepID=A0A176Y895_9BRAD|nr:excisionase [Bradyrhizobium centrolobii]